MLRDVLLEPLRLYFANHGQDLVAAYLFGSVARGDERADSDVDIGIVLGRRRALSLEDLDRVAGMQDELVELVHRPVDLVALDHASPDLVRRVLLDRVLLHERNREERVEFEIQARNAFFDLAPHLTRYRRAVLDRA